MHHPTKVKCKTSGIQEKIIRHTRKQENNIQNEEKNQSIKISPEEIIIIKLVNIKSYYNYIPYYQKLED